MLRWAFIENSVKLAQNPEMNLLVVGAGAIGSVYGYVASKASVSTPVKISYLVKPKHRENLKSGITLYPWIKRKAELTEFRDYTLLDSLSAVKDQSDKIPFDVVLLTLPSDRLREGDWLRDLFQSVGEAKIWSLQPNYSDKPFIEAILEQTFGEGSKSRLVIGRIPLMSYLAPLPGETFPKPGYAFFIPPGTKALWSAADSAAAEEAALFFSSGGLPSKFAENIRVEGLFSESLLRCVVAGLEKSEWSFDKLLHGTNLPLVTEGVREMTAIQAKLMNVADPGNRWWGKLGSGRFAIKSALQIASALIPFDFEAFLRVHFTKVENQMHLSLNETIDAGKSLQLSTTNLVLLRGRKRQTAPRPTEFDAAPSHEV